MSTLELNLFSIGYGRARGRARPALGPERCHRGQSNDAGFVARRNGRPPEGCPGRPSIGVSVTANAAGFQTGTEPIPPAVGFVGFGSSAGRRHLARPRSNIGRPRFSRVAEAVQGGLVAVASVRASWPTAGDRSPAQGRSNAIPCGSTRSIWQCRGCLFPEHHNAGPPDTPSTGYRQDARRNAHGQAQTARRNACRSNHPVVVKAEYRTTVGVETPSIWHRELPEAIRPNRPWRLPDNRLFLEQNRGLARQTPV